MDVNNPTAPMNVETNNTINLEIQQFHEICRTCLVQGAHKPIFQIIYNQKSLTEILSTCSTIQLLEEDFLPQNICSTCFSDILQMYTFFEKCQKSDAVLRYIIQLSIKPKKEVSGSDAEIYNNDSLDVTNSDSECDTIKETTKIANRRRKLRTRKISRVKVQCPPFKCKQCGDNFEEKALLKEHQKSAGHSEVRTHSCPVCFKMFTSSKLRQHMRSHTKEKPYKCNICFQAFSISGNLKRHTMTHTGERPHICNYCGKGFIQATTLHKHRSTHYKLEEYNNRLSTDHIQCNFCGRTFKRLARYHAHLKRHNTETGEIIKQIVEKNETPNEYVCIICNRAFKTKHLLKAHERTHGEKRFLCSECGKSFLTNAALQSHFRVHTGEKPYSCNTCKKAFSHVGSFEVHLLTHSGKKPHQCTVCSRAFTQLTHLKYHARTHSGERPYICSYCGRSFALNGNLTVHIRTHTGETPFVCSICNKGFHDSSSMKKHKKGHFNNLDPPAPHMQLPPTLPSVPSLLPPLPTENNLGYLTTPAFNY